MIGSLLSRLLVMAFGYVYPAYECYKTLEEEKTDIHQLLFWCQYWILVALVTVCERVGDVFVSWIPFYDEAKIVLFIYLWYPQTRGAIYIYKSFIKPYVGKHQKEIDRKLLEMKNEGVKIAILVWQKGTQYGQIKMFEILQYVSSLSSSTRFQIPTTADDELKSKAN